MYFITLALVKSGIYSSVYKHNMYICTPVFIYTHTHTYILVTRASCSPEGQKAKKQSFWVCCLGFITDRSVWGFCWSQTLLRETLATQLSRHILQDHPVPVASVCHPGRSRAPRGTPISAVGQGNLTLQPGHGAPGTASMPPWHPLPAMGTGGKGLPAAASLRGAPGDGLMCVLR